MTCSSQHERTSEKWNDARDHMHHLMKITKAWADKNGITFCDGKSKVLASEHMPLTHQQTRHLVDAVEDWKRSKEPEVPGRHDQQQAHLVRPRA
jgi:hypothetical protein